MYDRREKSGKLTVRATPLQWYDPEKYRDTAAPSTTTDGAGGSAVRAKDAKIPHSRRRVKLFADCVPRESLCRAAEMRKCLAGTPYYMRLAGTSKGTNRERRRRTRARACQEVRQARRQVRRAGRVQLFIKAEMAIIPTNRRQNGQPTKFDAPFSRVSAPIHSQASTSK